MAEIPVTVTTDLSWSCAYMWD